MIAVISLAWSNIYSQPFLPPPDSLTVSQECDFINLKWQEPDHELLTISGYNVYLADSLLINTTDTTFQFQKQGNGFVVFNITTVYEEGESEPVTTEVELVIFSPVTGLIYNEENCEFHWSPPEGNLPDYFYTLDETLQWCDNSGTNSIGTGGEVEFEVAAIWSPQLLSQFQPGQLYLKNVEFWPAESQASYIIRIWESQDNEAPDLLLFSQQVDDFIINQWNLILLSASVLIDIDKYLWVGYSVVTPTGYPAGVDEGPAVNGFGNMMNFGGWQTLLEINDQLDYNWKIRAGCSLYDTTNLYYDIYGYWACYNWAQNWVKLNEDPISDTTFFYMCVYPMSDWVPDNCFVQVNYCNMPVNSDTIECNICFFGNSDPIDDEEDDHITITNSDENWILNSNEKIQHVTIYDLAGRIIYRGKSEMNTCSVNNQNFSPGIYILEISTNNIKLTRKVIK